MKEEVLGAYLAAFENELERMGEAEGLTERCTRLEVGAPCEGAEAKLL